MNIVAWEPLREVDELSRRYAPVHSRGFANRNGDEARFAASGAGTSFVAMSSSKRTILIEIRRSVEPPAWRTQPGKAQQSCLCGVLRLAACNELGAAATNGLEKNSRSHRALENQDFGVL